MTWKRRRCDVVTSHRHRYDVMCLLGICPPPPPNIYTVPSHNIQTLAPQYSKPSYAYDLIDWDLHLQVQFFSPDF